MLVFLCKRQFAGHIVGFQILTMLHQAYSPTATVGWSKVSHYGKDTDTASIQFMEASVI